MGFGVGDRAGRAFGAGWSLILAASGLLRVRVQVLSALVSADLEIFETSGRKDNEGLSFILSPESLTT